MKLKSIFFIDGVRTPFQLSGTNYQNLNSYQLASFSLKGLLNKFNSDIQNDIGNIILGNVIQDSKTSNISRESALISGLNNKIPANTVSMACISSNKAITDCINDIIVGNSMAGIAGGVETMSDLPIKLSKPVRKILIESTKWRNITQKINGISKLKLKDIGIEVPSITEFSTNETMGYSADKLAHKWNVSRSEQDEFAFKSHISASKAQTDGNLSDVLNISVPNLISHDNIIKHNTNLKKLNSLKPVFIKNFGSITAGNASSLTDGASNCLLANEEFIEKYNLNPKCEIVDYLYYGTDPNNELLLGPAYATSILLKKNNLSINDIDVFEIHEAFAGQVLANINALDSTKFAQNLNLDKQGIIPMDKINSWGGSLSLGHPFGATGVRLLSMASNRLKKNNSNLGLITACAAGGLGHAMIIKNIEN